MSLKIGILSFQWADNYGGLLQCYALKEYLKQRGNEVIVINYWPRYALVKRATRVGSIQIKKQFGITVTPNAKMLIKNIVLGRYHSSKMVTQKMDNFRKSYITESQKFYLNHLDLEQDIYQFDVLICGSDQIWNPNLTGNQFDKAYFLDFNTQNTIKISYAASLGVSLRPEWEREFHSLLCRLQHISTRESSLSQLIQNRYGLNSRTVADPVLLLSEKSWNRLITDKKIKQRYILLYVLQRNSDIVAVANWLSCTTNLPIHVIGAKRRYKNAKYIKECSVEEFLTQFKNAEYILTNSFHGTAFSLIFRKTFMTFLDTNKPARMLDLLTNVGLSERIFRGDNKEIALQKPDYDNASKLLDIMIKDSKDYLSTCILPKRKNDDG